MTKTSGQVSSRNLVDVKISSNVHVGKDQLLSVALLNARSVNNKALAINDLLLTNI